MTRELHFALACLSAISLGSQPCAIYAGSHAATASDAKGGRPVPSQILPAPGLEIDEMPDRPRLEANLQNRRVLDAFDALPRPQRIGPTSIGTRSSENAPEVSPLMLAVFPDAAQFRWPTAWNDPTPRATAVIYEGMQIQVYENGTYETSFVIEAPRTALVLRLQLTLWERVDGRDFRRGQITLPPIVIEPELNSSRHQPSHSYTVRRTGYSHLLTGIPKDEIQDFRITRSGTADFGSLPAP